MMTYPPRSELALPFRLLLSASQIQLFEDCQRKWAWRYLAGLKPPPNKSAELGIKIHGVIEKHLKTRMPIDLGTEEGQIALSGADLWPAQPLGVEAPFKVPIPRFRDDNGNAAESVIWLHGYIDVAHVDADGIPVVTDHKTTVDFGWAKRAFGAFDDKTTTSDWQKSLLADIQACIYAYVGFVFTKAPRVRLRWIYYRTRGAKRRLPIVQEVSPEDIRPTLQRVQRLADGIARIPRTTHPTELPPNVETCGKFGGCPYVSQCNLTVQQLLEATMTQGNSVDQAHAQHQQMMAAFGAGAPQGQQAPMQFGPPPGQPIPPPQQMAPQQQQQQPQMQQYQQPTPTQFGQQPPMQQYAQPAAPQQPQYVQQPVPQQTPVQTAPQMAPPTIPDLTPQNKHWEMNGQAMIPVDGPCPPQWAHLNPLSPVATAVNPPAPQMQPMLGANVQAQAPIVPQPAAATPGKRKRGRPTGTTADAKPPRERMVVAATAFAEALADLIEENGGTDG